MEHISTLWLYSGLLAATLLTQSVYTQSPSTQNDIDNIAKNLQVKVSVQTNHLSKGTYEIAYQITNAGTTKILDTSDWEIIYSMHNKDLLTRPEFVVHGFVIKPYKDCLYQMTSTPGVFPGLNAGQAFKITVEAKGLSVFKQDIHPRFIVRSPNTVPKTIASTDDLDLGFVYLSADNKTDDDFSLMSGVRRTMVYPDVMDIGRVPATVVIPPPKNISVAQNMPLFDLGNVTRFYIWADNSVSETFKKYFQDVFTTIPGVTAAKIQFVNAEPPATADKIFIQIKPDSTKSDDYYKLAIRPKVPQMPNRNFNLIHISATTEKGLHNAVQSLMSAVGVYNIAPDMTIEDDPRFEFRSLSLDLTKHIFPVATIKKVLKLMSTYKLNKLELNLGGDDGWRLEIPDMPTLVQIGSKRCLGQTESECLLPGYGAGATAKPTASGHYSQRDFADILSYAKTLHIDVIPRFNFLGGILSAKKASHHFYESTKASNPTLANNLHLISPMPTIPAAQMPEEPCSIEGLLDPCKTETFNFINTVLKAVNSVYQTAGVKLTAFHAGGDDLTQFLGQFPSCKQTGVSTADALRTMIGSIQGTLASVGAVLHVNEEAIIDPATNDCLEIPAGSKVNKGSLIAHFYKTYPGSPDEWNLTPEQLTFMDAEVPPYPDEANPTATPDPLKPYTGPKKGLTQWIRPYRCANKGYKIVLKPENFFALDQAYELDWEEPGRRYMKRFHVINLHRMMMYEPLNHYINMDLGKDGYTFLQYRLCKLFPCETLTKPENVLGLQATLDTSVIRTEEMLWHMLLPRLLCFAEKAWRQGEHENILKAEVPDTLVNQRNLDFRAQAINMEMETFLNNLAYKEIGRMDAGGYLYRVPRLGASIQFGVPFNRKPPYPVMVKTDIPGLEIEYKDLKDPNPVWKPLFEQDPNTGMITGGYTFDFPVSEQKIELRAKTESNRAGQPTLLTGSTNNYIPREIPIELREGTCLPIEEAYTTEMNDVTPIQWKRILQNIDVAVNEQQAFMMEREQNLTTTINDYNRQNQAQAILPMVFQGIQNALASGTDMSTLPATNIMRMIHDIDMAIYDARARFVDSRFASWQAEYLRCKAGQAQPSVIQNPVPSNIPAGPPPGPVPRGLAQQGGMGSGQPPAAEQGAMPGQRPRGPGAGR